MTTAKKLHSGWKANELAVPVPRRHRDGLPGVCWHSRIRLVPAHSGVPAHRARSAETRRCKFGAIKTASWRLVTSSAQGPGFSQHRESYILAPINSLQRGSRLVGRRRRRRRRCRRRRRRRRRRRHARVEIRTHNQEKRMSGRSILFRSEGRIRT